MIETEEESYGEYIIELLNTENAEGISTALSLACETPWLVPSPESIKSWLKVFPEGQYLIKKNNQPVSLLMFTKTNWDGNIDNLSKDVKAKEMVNTFTPNGNTLVLSKALIPLDYEGIDMQKVIVEKTLSLSEKLKTTHILFLTQPNGFGKAKRANSAIDFWEYCQQNDSWLSGFKKNGVQIVKPAYRSLRVDNIDLGMPLNGLYTTFMSSYKPEHWDSKNITEIISPDGGVWYIDPDHQPKAVYVGNNVWGLFTGK